MIETNRIPFLNTYIDNLTAFEAKSCIDQLIQSPGYHYVVTPNSDIVVKMQDDPELKSICEKADLILTDGRVVVKISRKGKYPIKERVAMTDFVWDVLDLADEKGYKVFLFGGKEDVLEKATAKVREKYPGLKIVDSYSPPFGFEGNKEQLEEANERIKKSGADIFSNLVRCYRSFYINPRYILSYDKTNKLLNLYHCDVEIPVGRVYKNTIISIMEDMND